MQFQSLSAIQVKEDVETVSQQQSIALVKNMIRTSVDLFFNDKLQISEICYLRNLFDEECCCTKNYAGIMINALHPAEIKEGDKPQVKSQEAWQLTRWLEEGVFDALEKQYLRGFVFAIYDHPENKASSRLLETYSCTSFYFLYMNRCFYIS